MAYSFVVSELVGTIHSLTACILSYYRLQCQQGVAQARLLAMATAHDIRLAATLRAHTGGPAA